MFTQSLRRPLIAGTLVCFAASASLMAQSSSSFYEPEVNSLILETVVNPANYNAPASAALPALVTTLLSTGQAQLRSRVDSYNPITRTYVATLFLCAPSEPSPAPAADLTNGNVTLLSQSTLRVESIYHVPGSPAAVGFAGRFTGPTANPAQLTVAPGTPFLLSFAYPADAISATGDQAAAFAEVSFLIPGSLNLYSQTGVGSIIVTPAPVPNTVPSSMTTLKRAN